MSDLTTKLRAALSQDRRDERWPNLDEAMVKCVALLIEATDHKTRLLGVPWNVRVLENLAKLNRELEGRGG